MSDTPTPKVNKVPGRIELVAKANSVAELLIYGDIGDSWYGESVAASDVVAQLSALDAKTIQVRINSYGGSVIDGLAIYNALKRHPARVEVTIDGLAASIASLIAMAGDTIEMPENALLMIHAPMGGVMGNLRDIEQYVPALRSMETSMASSYASKTGKPVAEMLALLQRYEDLYYSAAEAKAAGFCDLITEDELATARAAKAQAVVAAQPEFARMYPGMPVQIAASLRAAAPDPIAAPIAAAINPPAVAGVITPVSGNQEVIPMDKTPEQLAADAKAQAALAVKEHITAMQARNAEIKAMAEPQFGNVEIKAHYDAVIAAGDPDLTAGDFGKQILAIMAKGRGPLGGTGSGTVTADERDNRIKGMGEAIQVRLGKAKADGKNHFAGLSMFDMARECAQAANVNTRGMSKQDVVRAAITHTSSDFSLLVGGAVNRSVLRGYNEFPEVFPEFTRAISVPDFRKQSLAGLGNFVGIAEVPEGGEYKYGTFSELGQEVQLKKLGGMFSITDEAIINDDLSLFDSVPTKMGAAAKRALGDRVFALITANPTMADGVALFHANHRNLLTGAAPTTAAIDQMIANMALQKDSKGNPVRAPLKFILVPVGLGGVVRTILQSQFEVGAGAARNNTTPNIVQGRFVVIEDPRLDAASATAFYGVADPNVIDSLVIAYRDGDQEPKTTQKEGWNIDGIEFKVRLDAAPAIADFIGLNKNPGA